MEDSEISDDVHQSAGSREFNNLEQHPSEPHFSGSDNGSEAQENRRHISSGESPDETETDIISPLWEASEAGQTDAVRTLLTDADLSMAVGPDGSTSLAIAAEKGHSQVVKLLLSKYNATVDGGWPLFLAAKHDRGDTVR